MADMSTTTSTAGSATKFSNPWPPLRTVPAAAVDRLLHGPDHVRGRTDHPDVLRLAHEPSVVPPGRQGPVPRIALPDHRRSGRRRAGRLVRSRDRSRDRPGRHDPRRRGDQAAAQHVPPAHCPMTAPPSPLEFPASSCHEARRRRCRGQSSQPPVHGGAGTPIERRPTANSRAPRRRSAVRSRCDR
jgi:hypothetical protein